MADNAVFIPSYHRPLCETARYLLEAGWSSPLFILVADDDESLPEYIERWGEHVIPFHKPDAEKETDLADGWGDERPTGVVPVRNHVAQIAFSMGFNRCWMFDDDYKMFVVTHSDDSREQLDTDEKLSHYLGQIEDFGYDTDIPVVGFCPNSIHSSAKYIKECSYRVFNGFNIDTRPGHFVPFSCRLFEDANHTMKMMRLGRTDFSFNHIYIVPQNIYYVYARSDKKATEGGLKDLYEHNEGVGLRDKQALNQVRHASYTLLDAPTACRLTIGRDTTRGIGTVFYNRPLQVKVLRQEWERHE